MWFETAISSQACKTYTKKHRYRGVFGNSALNKMCAYNYLTANRTGVSPKRLTDSLTNRLRG